MKDEISISTSRDLPGITDEVVVAAGADPGLMGALKDYQQACRRLSDPDTTPEDRAIWTEIRAELVTEIGRLYRQLVASAT